MPHLYPPGSLKAKVCVEGRKALYAYLNERGLPYRACGKLIVATSAGQAPALELIAARAVASGVDSLRYLDAAPGPRTGTRGSRARSRCSRPRRG